MAKHCRKWEEGRFKAGEKRVLITKWVGRAWLNLHASGPYLPIVKAFQNAGITLPADESQDHLIKIQGLPGYRLVFSLHFQYLIQIYFFLTCVPLTMAFKAVHFLKKNDCVSFKFTLQLILLLKVRNAYHSFDVLTCFEFEPL